MKRVISILHALFRASSFSRPILVVGSASASSREHAAFREACERIAQKRKRPLRSYEADEIAARAVRRAMSRAKDKPTLALANCRGSMMDLADEISDCRFDQ